VAGVSAVVLLGAAWLLLARGGVVRSRLHGGVVATGAWIVVVALAVNTAANLAGRHPVERWGMGTVSFVACVLAAVVAGDRRRYDTARRSLAAS
jgi:hypothetical protein